MTFLRFFFVAAAASAFACSSSSSPAAPPADAGADVVQPGPEDAAPPSDAKCDALAVRLKEGLDAERKKEVVQHAALGVTTARCGKTIVFSDAPTSGFTATPESLWEIGSATKTFIAATALNVAESGKVSLDDALAKYIPDFPNAANITLRHLLSHTSGIFDYLQTPELKAALAKDSRRVVSADELIAFAAAHPPNFEPGKGWSYSNTNFILLGRVIEKATGGELGATVRANAIARAGLGHTFFASTEQPVGTLVPAFDGIVDVTGAIHPSWFGAAGAMESTPSDALDWIVKLAATDDVVSPASKAQMFAMVKTDVSYLRYGLGLMEWDASKTDGNGAAYGHLGSVPGYVTELRFHPQTKVGLVVLASDSGANTQALVALAYGALHALD